MTEGECCAFYRG